MRKHIAILILAWFGLLIPVARAGSASSLAGYLEQALAANDDLRAARAAFQAETARIRQAGVLPDPKLTLQYYLQPVETRTGPQNAALGLSQAIPWFGKLSLLRQLQDRQAAITGIRLAALELQVAQKVKETYIEYGYLGRALKTVTDNIELLRYLEGVARSRYAAGTATFFNVLKIQIELARADERQQSLMDQTVPLRIRLNSLLGSAPDRARPLPAALPAVTLVRDEDQILALARENAPVLREARERIVRARLGEQLAEKDFFPDLGLSLKTIFTGQARVGNPSDSGDDPLIVGLSVNLPLDQDRRRARVAEKQAETLAARSLRDQRQRDLDTDIEQILYSYREAQRAIALYRDDLLPKVNQQLEVAINGFQSGQISILELIDAEQNLLNFELAKNRAVADRALAVARLESRIGTTLADWQSPALPSAKPQFPGNLDPSGSTR